MNSLQETSTELASKIVEIRLSIRHPQNKNKVFILLEGRTDIKLFRKLFFHQYTDTPSLDGKDKLIEALSILRSEGYTNIIGIRDADFEHLENHSLPENIFLTDFHDMEVEMIESDKLESVIAEFSTDECYPLLSQNLKENIYNIALEIGYIRWYSEKKNGLFNFKRIKWNSLISHSNCQILLDKEKLIICLLEQITNNELNIQEEADKLKEISTDKLQISNGHDLTMLISNCFSNGNINQSKIEEALRLSYHFKNFENTKLFNDLTLWANSNNYQLFATL